MVFHGMAGFFGTQWYILSHTYTGSLWSTTGVHNFTIEQNNSVLYHNRRNLQEDRFVYYGKGSVHDEVFRTTDVVCRMRCAVLDNRLIVYCGKSSVEAHRAV